MNVGMITWDQAGQIYPIRLLATILAEAGHNIKILLPYSLEDKDTDPNDPQVI